MATVEATPAASSVPADETRVIEELRSREGAPMPGRDRTVALAICSVFLAAAATLAAASSAPPVGTLLLLVAVYALVSRVNFEVGSGWAVPSELVLVPMLVVLPAACVPLCVA